MQIIRYDVDCCLCGGPAVLLLPVSVEFEPAEGDDNDVMCTPCRVLADKAEEVEIQALMDKEDAELEVYLDSVELAEEREVEASVAGRLVMDSEECPF